LPPPLETADLDRTAVYLAFTGQGRYEPTFAAAVEIPVRWVTGRTEARGPDGGTVSLDAAIATDRTLAIGSKVWLGELADWTGTGSNDEDAEIHRVATDRTAKDIKGVQTRYEFGLQKWRDG
jgi:hypothetical protein